MDQFAEDILACKKITNKIERNECIKQAKKKQPTPKPFQIPPNYYTFNIETDLYDRKFFSSMRINDKPTPIKNRMIAWYGILGVLIILLIVYILETYYAMNFQFDYQLENLILIILIGFIFGVLGSIYSWYGKYGKTNVGDKYFVDIWSFGHCIFHIGLVLLFNFYLHSYWIAFLISTGIGLLWEVGEFLLAYSFVKLRTVYEETIWNSLSDLIFGLLGSFLAYFLI